MWELFRLFFRIGILSFGGGNAAMPYIEYEVVEKKKWLKDEEFYELVAVTNSLPGPNMIQVCGYIGLKRKKFPGMVVATFSMLLPPTFLFVGVVTVLKDRLDPEVMEKVATGAIWFVIALLINLCWKMIRKSLESNINIYFMMFLCGGSIAMMFLGAMTAFVIIGSIFTIYFYSLMFDNKKITKKELKEITSVEKEIE